MADTFTALVLDERDGQVTSAIQKIERDRLPEGDVLVRVAYSGLNYKDGLALAGKNKIVRFYPMVPGIDFAGTVEESSSPRFMPGDRVVLTGWGVGERHWGGYAQFARVKADWLVPLEAGYDFQHAMAIGTAGVTAMLSIVALEEHGMQPDGREVLVTGASGGVGSLAVAILARLGYTVVAETGKAERHDYLKSLGAHEIIERAALAPAGGPLGSARWGGAVDTVGGEMLAGALRTMAYGASVAACGNAGGFELHTSVLPFILRSVNLLGIDSLPVPQARRITIWNRLARDLPPSAIERTMHVIPLAESRAMADEILAARTTGHIVVDVNA
ncbi:MAG TPA: MDR family oxidoreductase [Ktedonobacterales bacterium]|jgi:acrylyl-CoA reductase (NADPH)|nr:MDR family oxidoreductase [Ktedonobacterales bacterium]